MMKLYTKIHIYHLKKLIFEDCGLKLLEHAGWLQDAWNSGGCIRDGYYSISEDPSGAQYRLMTCGRCVKSRNLRLESMIFYSTIDFIKID